MALTVHGLEPNIVSSTLMRWNLVIEEDKNNAVVWKENEITYLIFQYSFIYEQIIRVYSGLYCISRKTKMSFFLLWKRKFLLFFFACYICLIKEFISARGVFNLYTHMKLYKMRRWNFIFDIQACTKKIPLLHFSHPKLYIVICIFRVFVFMLLFIFSLFFIIWICFVGLYVFYAMCCPWCLLFYCPLTKNFH